jgi:hypothetical protein
MATVGISFPKARPQPSVCGPERPAESTPCASLSPTTIYASLSPPLRRRKAPPTAGRLPNRPTPNTHRCAGARGLQRQRNPFCSQGCLAAPSAVPSGQVDTFATSSAQRVRVKLDKTPGYIPRTSRGVAMPLFRFFERAKHARKHRAMHSSVTAVLISPAPRCAFSGWATSRNKAERPLPTTARSGR